MAAGYEIIRACPHCEFPVRQRVVQEIDDPDYLEGVYWTDGKEQLPLFPPSPRLIHCENCRGFYWKREAKRIGICDPSSDDPGKSPDAWEHV